MADDIKPCRELDERLAPYVDGEAAPDLRRAVEAHLAACPPCHDRADDERSARDMVVQHRAALRPAAPSELRARCAALQSVAAIRHAPAFARASAGQARVSAMPRLMPLSLAAL